VTEPGDAGGRVSTTSAGGRAGADRLTDGSLPASGRQFDRMAVHHQMFTHKHKFIQLKQCANQTQASDSSIFQKYLMLLLLISSYDKELVSIIKKLMILLFISKTTETKTYDNIFIRV
jgi:hypothetical protein